MTCGKFITLEGGEGTGKSTQARALAKKLRETCMKVVETREPGGSVAGEALRALLLGGTLGAINPLTEALLFSAARSEHIDKTIRPALARGDWVVCDRYMDSTRAYQGLEEGKAGSAGGLTQEKLEALEKIVVGQFVPDLTLLLDLPADEGLARAQRRHALEGLSVAQDSFESRSIDFHDALRKRFLSVAQDEPQRIKLINAAREEEDVAADIWSVVCERFL